MKIKVTNALLDDDSITVRLTPKSVSKLLIGVGRTNESKLLEAFKVDLVYGTDKQLIELHDTLLKLSGLVLDQVNMNYKGKEK